MRYPRPWLLLLLFLILSLDGLAQAPESLAHWPRYRELSRGEGNADLLDFLLDGEVLASSRRDLADLRLYDSSQNEIPYALRILQDRSSTIEFMPQEFNRGERDHGIELSLDLGTAPSEHNQVEIRTSGENFRRNVTVEGSQDGTDWLTLASDRKIFRFTSSGRTTENRTVDYPLSRHRYLRIRVEADAEVDERIPTIEEVRVRKVVVLQGEKQSYSASLGERSEARDRGRASSVFMIDLGGQVPLIGLRLAIAEAGFSRSYRLEGDDQGSRNSWRIAEGELRPDPDHSEGPITIEFQEQYVRRLRLTVVDDRNPPLTIQSATGFGWARQILFKPPAVSQGPFRLYFGNQKAAAPNYDFADSLGDPPAAPPLRISLGAVFDNPDYVPEAAPLTDRYPWLIYVVLLLVILALLWILRSVARSVQSDSPRNGP